MPEVVEQTSTGKTVTKFFSGFLTPQIVLILIGGIFSLFVFWKNTTDNWKKTSDVEQAVKAKADQSDLQSLSERVNRQYETNNKILDRIIEVEKKLSFEAGVSQGERDERRRQRDLQPR